MKFTAATTVVVVYASTAALSAPLSAGPEMHALNARTYTTPGNSTDVIAEGLLGSLPVVGGLLGGLLNSVEALLPPDLLKTLLGLPVVGGLLGSLEVHDDPRIATQQLAMLKDVLSSAAAQYSSRMASLTQAALAADPTDTMTWTMTTTSSTDMPAPTMADVDDDDDGAMDMGAQDVEETPASSTTTATTTTDTAAATTDNAQDDDSPMTTWTSTTASETTVATAEKAKETDFSFSEHVGRARA